MIQRVSAIQLAERFGTPTLPPERRTLQLSSRGRVDFARAVAEFFRDDSRDLYMLSDEHSDELCLVARVSLPSNPVEMILANSTTEQVIIPLYGAAHLCMRVDGSKYARYDQGRSLWLMCDVLGTDAEYILRGPSTTN